MEGKELLAAQTAEPVLAAGLALGSNDYRVFLPDLYCMTGKATGRVKEKHLPEQP